MLAKLEDYHKFVLDTAKTDVADWELISILGLTEELAEYTANPTPEELGDVLWYLVHFMCMYCDHKPLFYLSASDKNMITNLGVLAGMSKKRLTHNPQPYTRRDIVDQANKLMWSIQVEANVNHGMYLQQIININKEKINRRIGNNTLLTIHR